MAYGLAVYLVMNYVVLPLSATSSIRFSLGSLLGGLVGHALLVGLPVALIARRSARNNLPATSYSPQDLTQHSLDSSAI